MRIGFKNNWIVLLLLCCNIIALGQPTLHDTTIISSSPAISPENSNRTSFVVGKIYIEGNRKTKSYTIERELPFKTGDSVYLTDLVKGFEIAKNQLTNTRLFNEVVVSLKSFRGYEADVLIQVKERWYIFPIPYLKPGDRNIAEWARHGYNLDRLKYGLKFTHYNFSGRKDKLKIWLVTGYTRQIEFQYDQPYATKDMKHGYKVGLLHSFNRETNVSTISNQQNFIDSVSSKNWVGYIEYNYRPALRTFHAFRLSITHQQVDSQVLALNPKYFNSANTKLMYPEFSYVLTYLNVDYIFYPLKGNMAEVSFLKKGLQKNINMWQLSGRYSHSYQLAKKTYAGLEQFGVIKLPFEQPFINQRLFGYRELYLRGLEDYVIDGVAGVLSRQTLRRELVSFYIPTYIKFLKSKQHDRIPFRIYAKTYADVGYVYNKNKNLSGNSLTNRMLYSGGFGIDIVSFYDFIIRIDYSFNQLGQKGFFFHLKNEF